MHLAGVSTSLRDLWTDVKDDPHHVDFRGFESNDVTIIHVQPEPYFGEAFRRSELFQRSAAHLPHRLLVLGVRFIPESWVAHAEGRRSLGRHRIRGARPARAAVRRCARCFPGVKLAPSRSANARISA
jgi:hypothetical protein